jgi:uncharacterized protein YbbC (DUF1343 family)
MKEAVYKFEMERLTENFTTTVPDTRIRNALARIAKLEKKVSHFPVLKKIFHTLEYIPRSIVLPTLAFSEMCRNRAANKVPTKAKPTLGIERLGLILDSLKGKRIAVVANQTSVLNNVHLVDTLLALKIEVVKVFAPEHGFRGQADAGEKINHSVDEKTGLPLVSLYGNNKKPSVEQLEDVDILLFDIQDVGVRFYTFISTLHYIMEAAAENGKKVIVLDRPNPNAHYIDGPVLEKEFTWLSHEKLQDQTIKSIHDARITCLHCFDGIVHAACARQQ